jgi:hypothetical protein
VRVGQALRLHVPGPVQVALGKAFTITERGRCFAHGGLILLVDLLESPGYLEAAAAAAEGRLDRDRQAVLAGEVLDLFSAGYRAAGARRERCANPLGDVTGLDLVAERVDGRRRRPDPGQARATRIAISPRLAIRTLRNSVSPYFPRGYAPSRAQPRRAFARPLPALRSVHRSLRAFGSAMPAALGRQAGLSQFRTAFSSLLWWAC